VPMFDGYLRRVILKLDGRPAKKAAKRAPRKTAKKKA
jgi:hypothetical protein